MQNHAFVSIVFLWRMMGGLAIRLPPAASTAFFRCRRAQIHPSSGGGLFGRLTGHAPEQAGPHPVGRAEIEGDNPLQPRAFYGGEAEIRRIVQSQQQPKLGKNRAATLISPCEGISQLRAGIARSQLTQPTHSAAVTAYAFDLSGIRNADALPESAIQAIAREDLKNNTYASDSEEFEMRLMNLCIRHGTGAKASYVLCPVWRVQTAGKGDIDFCLAVSDAVSGKRLFEGLL